MTQAVEVKLPKTAEDTDESVVVLWYKSEGEHVLQNDVLVEVQSEKATFEIEAPASGILREIKVKRAGVAAVGDVLAVIETETEAGNTVAAGGAETEAGGEVAVGSTEAEVGNGVVAGSVSRAAASNAAVSDTAGGFVSAPPRIRRLASQLGVNLAQLKGTGPNGRITEADIQSAAKASPPSPEPDTDGGVGGVGLTSSPATVHAVGESQSVGRPGTSEAMSLVRKTIAKRMVQSLQQSAQLTLNIWADVTKLATQRTTLSPEASWNTWVLAAVAKALKQHPYLNATLVDDTVEQFDVVHLGVAVDTEAGLMVPVIQEADKKGLAEIQAETAILAEKVRSGKVTSTELSGATFTVTNLGAYGVEFFTPIINPPEAAILGVGKIDEKVVFRDNSLSVMYRIPLSLTFDHRLTDGGPAARFLASVAENLDHPERLI